MQSRDDVVRNADVPRVSLPYFTKYEYTTLLAVRQQQLAEGAAPLVPLAEFNREDPQFLKLVAEREILERKLPYMFQRTLPNGAVEYWAASELELLS